MSRHLTLLNAVKKLEMPSLGLGTYLMKGSEGRLAVDKALFYGYRHIDTARRYDNEDDVGDVVQAKVRHGALKRADLFITTKIPSVYFAPADVKASLEESLEALKTPYVDMLLLHYPWGNKNRGDGIHLPVNAQGERELENYDLNKTWTAMEKVVDSGKALAIGMSNFSIRLMEGIWQNARIKPANLQCECHVYLQQQNLLRYCKSRNMVMTAYAPFGAPGLPKRAPNEPFPLEDAIVKNVAKKHKRSAGQVLLRHMLQRNIVVIPKSSSEKRIRENIEVYNFELDESDMQNLNKLDRNLKLFPFEWAKRHPLYMPGEEF
ncbi:1,5-anhydro-D-fructose reductase-like [Liolophura sinensis]|uniref:1,5-anhydro-D-fructose reductase-like n=1 Tax=Liolophura sinensis TaxID=3198878 RepID=UPI003158D3EC